MLCIRSLALHHFRNYTYAALDSDAPCVILSGPNGAGKTNVLEALSLLSPGRGLRKSKLAAMTQAVSSPPERGGGPKGWTISAQCDGMLGPVHIGTALDMQSGSERRLVKIDGEAAKSQTALTQHLAISWQTPQMDGLFQESDSARRRYLDRLVYGLDPEHLSRVHAYEHAMRERNRLLGDGRMDALWLSALEERMAQTGVAVCLARLEAVERLNTAMQAHGQGAFPRAQLALKGPMEQALQDGQAALDVEGKWMDRLASLRLADRAAGRATWGCHRSGFLVTHEAKQSEAAWCSTGEQKALLLSILLAHARARKDWLGAAPLLLLDEVVAHLDAQRRAALADALEALKTQYWLTGTDAADFSAFAQAASRFKVDAGSFVKQS